MSWSCDLRRPSLCWPLKTLCWTLSGSWGCLEHKIPFFLAQLCSKPLSAPESACLGLTVRGAHEPALGNTWRFFWKGGCWFQHNSHQELRLGSSGFTHHHPPLQSLRVEQTPLASSLESSDRESKPLLWQRFYHSSPNLKTSGLLCCLGLLAQKHASSSLWGYGTLYECVHIYGEMPSLEAKSDWSPHLSFAVSV